MFSATRGTKSLVGAALHSSGSITDLNAAATDAKTMLNWGFAHYR
jgi:hypothetical protein